MVNTYRAEFFARCPVNGARIKYALRIESQITIAVEDINDAIDDIRDGFHEDIANRLLALGGKQTLTAEHHGVSIETERP